MGEIEREARRVDKRIWADIDGTLMPSTVLACAADMSLKRARIRLSENSAGEEPEVRLKRIKERFGDGPAYSADLELLIDPEDVKWLIDRAERSFTEDVILEEV